jgi:hypothetical protein
MNKFLKIVGISAVAGLAVANAAVPAPLVAPVIDTTDFLTIAGSVLAATGVFFGVRKAIGLLY